MGVKCMSIKCMRVLLGVLVLLWGVAFAVMVQAQDEKAVEEGEEEPLPSIYLPIKPAFVVNYGGEGRLKYIKTELSVRLRDSDAANSVRHHLPYVRHKLVMLFARQTDEELSSQEGREQLRTDILGEIKSVIEQEDGDGEGIIDVFFNTFIVQN